MPYCYEPDTMVRERRKQLYIYAINSNKTLAAIQPYFTTRVETLKRIATGHTKTPTRGTDLEMAKYLRIKESTLDEYLTGKIDLNELCNRQGEHKIVSTKTVTVDTIAQDVLSLPLPKRIEALSKIAQMVHGNALSSYVFVQPEPKKITLTADERDRLKSIFAFSLSADGREPEDLIDDGVCPDLIEYLDSTPVEAEFTAEDYLPLLSSLYRVTKWVTRKTRHVPMLDLEETYKDDLDSLLDAIRFSEELSVAESNVVLSAQDKN